MIRLLKFLWADLRYHNFHPVCFIWGHKPLRNNMCERCLSSLLETE